MKTLYATAAIILLLGGCATDGSAPSVLGGSGGKTDGYDAGTGDGGVDDPPPAEEDDALPRWRDDDGEPDERTGLHFEDAYLQCFDGEVEIGIYADGPMIESGGGMGDVALTPGHRIEIRGADGRFLTFDENIVATTDGFGNDTFQVLFVDSYGIELVVNLHYDHELGHLAGHWEEPQWWDDRYLSDFGDRHHVAEEMNCWDYTYGDL